MILRNREGLFEGRQEALVFLQTNISVFESVKNLERVLVLIRSIIIKFEKEYQNQDEILEKLEKFLISYENIMEAIKN